MNMYMYDSNSSSMSVHSMLNLDLGKNRFQNGLSKYPGYNFTKHIFNLTLTTSSMGRNISILIYRIYRLQKRDVKNILNYQYDIETSMEEFKI